MKLLEFLFENYENHENLKIPQDTHQNHENLGIPKEKQDNH